MLFEWTPIDNTAALEIWIFEKVWEYQQQMRELVLEILDRNVILEKIDTSRGIRTIYFPTYINHVENNLKLLIGTDVPENSEATITWHGGFLDIRWLDYRDVNRWFKTLQLFYKLLLTFKRVDLTTNTFRTSTDLDLQVSGLGLI